MGVFDFVKEAGAKIGIGESKADKEAAAAAASAERAAELAAKVKERRAASAAKAADAKAAAAKAERAEKLEEAKRSVALEQYISGLGFDVKNLDIRYDSGLATVTGEAADQATRERVILAIGNTEGVERVEDEITVPENAEPEAQLHVVVRGDTLSAIAKTYYGDAMKYPVIFEANRPMLTDPDKIYVGQVLRIPPQ